MNSSYDSDQLRIVSAPWLITMTGPALQNGAVLLDRETILEVGELAVVSGKNPDIEVEFFPGLLMPALINAHMHLELSHLRGCSPLPPEKNFIDWVEQLLIRRYEDNTDSDVIQKEVDSQINQQFTSGVIFIGNIGNDPSIKLPANTHKTGPVVYHMLEMLGSSRDAATLAGQHIDKLDSDIAVVAHAPYSTRPELLKKIKDRCDTFGHIFSVHTAEVKDEHEFIRMATGIFHDFLVQRGAWSDDFFKEGKQASTTVKYFADLGLLNDRTLLVHCVHVTESDLELIKKSGAHVCICPGSNTFLHTGRAPLEAMLDSGLLPAIGTDSYASNLTLDMWEEMKHIYNNYPEVAAHNILAMATQGGARAFGRDKYYGEIAPGKTCSFLHMESEKIINCNTENELLKMLVSNGRPENIEWIHQTFMISRDN